MTGARLGQIREEKEEEEGRKVGRWQVGNASSANQNSFELGPMIVRLELEVRT